MRAPENMPTPPPLPPSRPQGDEALAAIIPYRNVPALIAYYCGVFSLIPCLGFILGIAAILLGTYGLRIAAEQPESKGKAHAWVGIIIGTVVVILHIGGFVFIWLGSRSGR
jgi:hypothetical protein